MFQAYCISCLITGRSYIGVTSRTLRQRWAEHLYDARKRNAKMAISRAVAKYGASNFTIQAVCSAQSWEDVCALESILIDQSGTRAPFGYNVSAGGDGAFGVVKSAESVERSAAKHRGKPCHPNTRAAALARKGVSKPDGFGAKIAASRRGVPRSAETKAKIAAYWAARRLSGEFKTLTPYAHSAMIAKIPLPLSRYIGATFYPNR